MAAIPPVSAPNTCAPTPTAYPPAPTADFPPASRHPPSGPTTPAPPAAPPRAPRHTPSAPVAARFHDFRQVHRLVVGDLVALPGFGAEHAGEVARIVSAQLRHAPVDRIHEESSSGQAIILVVFTVNQPVPEAFPQIRLAIIR